MSTLLDTNNQSLTTSSKDRIKEDKQNGTILVIVNFMKKNFKFRVESDSTLRELKALIDQKTTVPPSLQKLILKGKILTDDKTTLNENKIKNKSKLMLIGSTIENVLHISAPGALSPSKKKKSTEQVVEEKKYLSEAKEHEKIVKKGVPSNAEKGEPNQNLPVPKTIKGLYNKSGEEVRLTLKNSMQQLWVASKDSTNKISYLQISDVVFEPIHNNKEYCIVGLKMGSNETTWLYYVPIQYTKALKYTILNGGTSNVPFLRS